jgi:DNA replication protein DnaC
VITTSDLTPLLKRLKLGTLLPTLPERLALARRDQLDYAAFLEVLLADEVSRRDQGRLERQVLLAGFEEVCRLEDFDWTAGITVDRRLLDAAFSLDFLRRHEHVLLVGPVGVGKTFLAQALGYAAIRAGSTVRFMQADKCFLALAQARVDHTLEKVFRSLLAPDLLIVDDLGLHRLTAQQSADLYEIIVSRHRRASFVITSNRSVDEWLGLFDDAILGNSALDRLANASYQIVVEGSSYRERLSPHRRATRAEHSGETAPPSTAPVTGGRRGRSPVA